MGKKKKKAEFEGRKITSDLIVKEELDKGIQFQLNPVRGERSASK